MVGKYFNILEPAGDLWPVACRLERKGKQLTNNHTCFWEQWQLFTEVLWAQFQLKWKGSGFQLCMYPGD